MTEGGHHIEKDEIQNNVNTESIPMLLVKKSGIFRIES